MPSDLRFTMDGDSERFEQELEKANKKIAQLKDSLKELQKQEGSYKGTLDDAVASLGNKVTALVSVGAAVGIVNTAYREQKKLVEEIGQKSVEAAKKTVAALVATGDLMNSDRILKAVGTDGMPAFAAISAAGSNLGEDRRSGLANELKKYGVLGGDIGQQGGMMAAIAEMFPGAKPDDIADLMFSVQKQGGAQAGAITGGDAKLAMGALGRAGQSKEGALALVLEGLTNDLPMKIVEKFGIAISDRTLKPIEGRGRPLEQDEHLFNQFVGADQAGRTRLLQQSEVLQKRLLGETAPDRLKNLDAARIAQREQELRDAQSGNFGRAQLKSLTLTAQGQSVLVHDRLDRDKARAEAAFGTREMVDVARIAEEQFAIDQKNRSSIGRVWASSLYNTTSLGLWAMSPLLRATGEHTSEGRNALEALTASGGSGYGVARRIAAGRLGVDPDSEIPSKLLHEILTEIRTGNQINAAAANRSPQTVGPNVHGEGAGGLTQ